MRSLRGNRGFTLIELLIVVIILGILTAIALPMFLSQRDKARDAAVKEGIHHIELGLGDYAVDNLDLYPDTVSRATFLDGDGQSYVDFWPKDPYAGGPMGEGTAPGSFTYTALDGRTTFSLVGHLGKGLTFSVP